MLLSNDLDMLQRARYLSTQARQPVPWYEHTDVGFNYRMSNILAALGRGQLQRLDGMIGRRREIRDRYSKALAPYSDVRMLGRSGADNDDDDNCWLTTIIIDRPGDVADRFVAALGASDIEARHVWKPMHLQPIYSQYRAFVSDVSKELFRSGVTLPSGANLSDEDIDRVVDVLTGLLEA
jgi:dTDP-4-amino-4,6-dideoxygalactose transaminase